MKLFMTENQLKKIAVRTSKAHMYLRTFLVGDILIVKWRSTDGRFRPKVFIGKVISNNGNLIVLKNRYRKRAITATDLVDGTVKMKKCSHS
jgi:hypothetical protein